MYRRLFLPALIGLAAGFGANLHEIAAVRAAMSGGPRFVHSGTPRGGAQHKAQRPPRKHCQHRKAARAKRRRARLRGHKG